MAKTPEEIGRELVGLGVNPHRPLIKLSEMCHLIGISRKIGQNTPGEARIEISNVDLRVHFPDLEYSFTYDGPGEFSCNGLAQHWLTYNIENRNAHALLVGISRLNGAVDLARNHSIDLVFKGRQSSEHNLIDYLCEDDIQMPSNSAFYQEICRVRDFIFDLSRSYEQTAKLKSNG